ncbi:MAG: hypothetical protein KDI37_02190, partial [Xanthomonadales bacterium]|nr:hypothetical protein [Xanthomonadales bacterium]
MIQFRRYLSSQLTTAVLLLCVGWSAAATSSAADLLSDAEWASVRAQMEAHRHRAEGDAVDGYRAYNPVLGLSQRFHPDGRIRVEGQRLQVSMRLTGYGYGELVQPGRPELRAETDAQGA